MYSLLRYKAIVRGVTQKIGVVKANVRNGRDKILQEGAADLFEISARR
jgi:hypothetical protein